MLTGQIFVESKLGIGTRVTIYLSASMGDKAITRGVSCNRHAQTRKLNEMLRRLYPVCTVEESVLETANWINRQ